MSRGSGRVCSSEPAMLCAVCFMCVDVHCFRAGLIACV